MERFVLGVKIDDINIDVAINRIGMWLRPGSELDVILRPELIPAGKKSMIVVTPGPEFLVTAQKDPEFKRILNAADLATPDGFGLRLAGIQNRVSGPELMLRLCQEAGSKGWTIGLLGGADGVAEKTRTGNKTLNSGVL